MPMRTIDTRPERPIAQRRHGSDQSLTRVPATSSDDDRERTSQDRPFNDWPFDFDPVVTDPAEGGGGERIRPTTTGAGGRGQGSGARQRR